MNNSVDNYSIMNTLNQALRNYISILNMDTAEPNTERWHRERSFTIGCSELYNVSGTANQVQTLLNRKRGMSVDLSRHRAVIWGNLFESSSKLVTEIILDTTIYNVNGSIKHTNIINSCSPDGIGIIKIPVRIWHKLMPANVQHFIKKGKRFSIDAKLLIKPAIIGGYDSWSEGVWQPPTITQDNHLEMLEILALFEFKSPFSRVMEHTKIKPDYLFQVLGGTEIISCTKIGAFVEVWFSECQLFRESFIPIADKYRSTGRIYFGACKYINITGMGTSALLLYVPEILYGLKPVQDYQVLDGPYMYNFGDKYVFHNEEFQESYNKLYNTELPEFERPTNLDEFNIYMAKLNNWISGQTSKPALYTFYQLDQISIKYIPKLEGFIKCLEPYCQSLLSRVHE